MENTSSAYVNGNGQIHFNKNKVHYSEVIIDYEFNKFFYAEILKLLLNVYEESVLIPRLTVTRIFRATGDGLRNTPLYNSDDGLFKVIIVLNDSYIVEFQYEGITYLTEFKTEIDRSNMTHYLINFTHIEDEIPNERVGFELLRLALSHTSVYRKGCFEINFNRDREVLSLIETVFVKPPESRMCDIFIKEDIKRDIERFIYTFNNFDKFNVPLRFLLSGKPGLGKTEIVRAVISECSKTGVVIIPGEMNSADWLTFEFAKLFKPALVCIDDIDLIFGKREDMFGKRKLNSFLSMLDGILQNKFFLIATTNDKNLVDLAASRPGRFDEIIDFGQFEKKFYYDLICKRTNDEKILSLFDEEIFDFMEKKKVTGAYIVNLIKQLHIMSEINPEFSKEDLSSYIKRNHKGFYNNQAEKKNNFGFEL